MSHSKVLFLMSGSIAAVKACQVISQLVKDGYEVQIVATPSTFQFVGAATCEGLTGRKVLSDLWESGHAMDHIHLTRWADFAILCPASANTLARLSLGLGDDLLAALTLAWPKNKPYWVFPAMNHEMLSHAATQEHLQRLQARGFSVAPTQSGALACGEEGFGRMLEAERILDLIRKPSLGHVLITAGATREPIDGIRFISNVSTGQTGACISDNLSAQGWQVTFMHGEDCAQPLRVEKRVGYSSFFDLNEKLHAELKGNDYVGVIHCAAVSDYSPTGANTEQKLETQPELNLKLKANFKILPRLKEYSRNRSIKVIGFKLALNSREEDRLAVAARSLSPTVDAIVANDWSKVRSGHPTTWLQPNAEPRSLPDLSALSEVINQFLLEIRHDSLS